jgi:hypothetical protein
MAAEQLIGEAADHSDKDLGSRQLLDHAPAGPLPPLQEDQEIGHLLPVRPLVELPDDVSADLARGGQDPKEIPTRRWSERVSEASRILPKHRGASVSVAWRPGVLPDQPLDRLEVESEARAVALCGARVLANALRRLPRGRGLDDLGHDPTVFTDLPVPDEPEFHVRRHRTVEEEARGHRSGVLRVSLDGPSAQARDQIDRTGERRGRHALTPVTLADVAARDPPIGRGRLTFLVGGAVLDPGHLVGRPELAPAHALFPVEHERRMGRSCPNPIELSLAIQGCVSVVVGMEAHAPAAAKDAVVSLDQRGEHCPRRRIESPDGVVRYHHETQSTVTPRVQNVVVREGLGLSLERA